MMQSKYVDSCHLVKFIQSRELNSTVLPKKSVVTDFHLSRAKRLYRKNLLSHYGCVNALEFSNDGTMLASAGDDRRVLLWNTQKAIHGKSNPSVMQAEHNSNVFVVAFDSKNSKLFSGGNDDQVILHDAETTKPLDYFIHEEPVYGISIDPLNDNIFATACDNGLLQVFDIRDPPSSTPFCLASAASAFHAVMFNPVEPRLIVSANTKSGVALWDVRMPKSLLLKYGGKNSDQCCMNARFSQDGTKILALRRRLPPILYSTDTTNHLFQFNHSGYYNSCTMKSCSFAGSDDQFVVSGSDNFDLYMWKIPTGNPPESDARLVQNAHLILRGHRSIVNQVRYNSKYSIIASSGVEKVIKLWSPFPLPSPNAKGAFEAPSDYDRRIYTNNDYINLILQSGQFLSLTYDTSRRNTREDPRMLAFFDALVQRDIEGMSDDEDEFHFRQTYSSNTNSAPQSPINSNPSLTSNEISVNRRNETGNENLLIRESDEENDAEDNTNSIEAQDGSPRENRLSVEPDSAGSDFDASVETGLITSPITEKTSTASLSKASSSREEFDQESESPVILQAENNTITRLIVEKQAQLIRMAQNHMRLELEGKTKVKRKHLTLLDRLKRLNRKTHSLTMNLLPFPGPVSSSSSAVSSGSGPVSDGSESSTSSSSSNSSSSSSNDSDDARFFKLKKEIKPNLINPSINIGKKVQGDASSGESSDTGRPNRDQETQEVLFGKKKRSAKPTGDEDERPCTSATALKRQTAPLPKPRKKSKRKKDRSGSSSSESAYDKSSESDQTDFITRLEEVSKRLKRVTDDLTSSSSLLTNTRYNPKRKQQSTMIRSPMSSSSSTTDSSSTSSVESILSKLPQPPKRKKRLSPSHKDYPKQNTEEDNSTESTRENQEENPSNRDISITTHVQNQSRKYRKHRNKSESSDSSD